MDRKLAQPFSLSYPQGFITTVIDVNLELSSHGEIAGMQQDIAWGHVHLSMLAVRV